VGCLRLDYETGKEINKKHSLEKNIQNFQNMCLVLVLAEENSGIRVRKAGGEARDHDQGLPALH